MRTTAVTFALRERRHGQRVGPDRRLGHAHHLPGDALGLLFVLIAWRADAQLGLNYRMRDWRWSPGRGSRRMRGGHTRSRFDYGIGSLESGERHKFGKNYNLLALLLACVAQSHKTRGRSGEPVVSPMSPDLT